VWPWRERARGRPEAGMHEEASAFNYDPGPLGRGGEGGKREEKIKWL